MNINDKVSFIFTQFPFCCFHARKLKKMLDALHLYVYDFNIALFFCLFPGLVLPSCSACAIGFKLVKNKCVGNYELVVSLNSAKVKVCPFVV